MGNVTTSIGYQHERLIDHPFLGVGEYRCTRHDCGMSEENRTGRNIVIFPQHGLMMKHVQGNEVPMDVNQAVFFNENEPYRVTHPCGCGDRGTTFFLSHSVMSEMLADLDASISDQPGKPFRYTHTPTDAGDFLQHRLVLRALRQGDFDAVWFEETVLDLLSRTLRRPYELRLSENERRRRARGAQQRRKVRDNTRAAHHELVRQVQIVLGRRYGDNLSLDEISREVHASPFHLARVFKAHAGSTIHQYLTRLRLREALHRLLDGAPNLTKLAINTGFSSHSKFTESFRREFGVTPSAVRDHRTCPSFTRR